MNSSRKITMIIGSLFLLVMVSWGVGFALVGSIFSSPDFLQEAYPARSRIIAGVLFEVVEIAAVMGIAVMLFSVLKKYNENIARAYLAIRTLECVLLITAALSALILISVSRIYTEYPMGESSSLNMMGALLQDIRSDWAHLILTPFYSLATLILNYVLFKTRLVPRFISIWGLAAASLVLINQIVVVVISHKLEFVPGALMGLNELFLGTWLIAKGFNPVSISE